MWFALIYADQTTFLATSVENHCFLILKHGVCVCVCVCGSGGGGVWGVDPES